MEQYILKSTLSAEIERLLRKYSICPTHTDYEKGLKEGRLIGYKDVLFKVNTSETKEVDLEKEATKIVQSKEFVEGKESPILLIAKYFYELGLKTQKENKL